MSRAARLAPIGLVALIAAVIATALGSVTPALAFDKVDHLQAVQAGRGYVYYIHEVDAQKRPLAGRSVTVRVGTVPGSGASVAASDANGHTTGPAGASATELSGSDGLAYFVLRTSTTPGQNEFTWSDTAWTGEVLVTGQPAAAAAHSAAPVAAGGHPAKAPAAPKAAPVVAHLAAGGVPPWAVGLAATVLVWAALPLVRRATGLPQRWRTKKRLVPLAALPDV